MAPSHSQDGKPVKWEKEIADNWWKLDLAPEEFSGNREVVLTAIHQDGLALRNASEELRRDWYLVAQAVCRDGEALQFAGDELRADPKLVRWAMGLRETRPSETSINIEEWTGPDHSEYNTLATSRIPQPNTLRHADEGIRGNDSDLMLHAINDFWFAADHLMVPLRDSKPFWRKVIEQNRATGWQAFGNYAPVVLREDEELMELAVAAEPLALYYAGPSLRKSRSFVVEAVRRDWRSLRCASEDFRADPEILALAAAQTLEALEYAGGDLGKVAKRAVQPPSQQVLEEAQEEWAGLQDPDEMERRQQREGQVRKDWTELMMFLTRTHGRALTYLRPTGVDRDLTQQAVQHNGRCLAYAEEEFREDRNLVNDSVRANIGICSGLVWRAEPKDLPDVDDLAEDIPEKKAKAKGRAKSRPKSGHKEKDVEKTKSGGHKEKTRKDSGT